MNELSCKRLTTDQRRGINRTYKNGYTYKDIMRLYNCGSGTVNRWINDGTLYKSINKIRKKRTGKPHKKHKPHKKGSDRKPHKRGRDRKTRTVKKRR